MPVNRCVAAHGPVTMQEWLPDAMATQEVLHQITHLELRGYFKTSRRVPFILSVTVNEAPRKKPNYKVFGKSGNPYVGDMQLVGLSLRISEKRMDVPTAALRDIYNAQIGEIMSVLCTRTGEIAIILNGPNGEPSYAAAFLFKDGQFWRRQVQSSPATLHKPVLMLDDSIYSK